MFTNLECRQKEVSLALNLFVQRYMVKQSALPGFDFDDSLIVHFDTVDVTGYEVNHFRVGNSDGSLVSFRVCVEFRRRVFVL